MLYFFVFLSGLFAFYFWTFIAWWVSSLSIGTLLFLWIQPHIATTTYLLGSLGWTASASTKFHKDGHLPKKHLTILAITAVIWWFLGSFIIYKIPDFISYKVTGITLLLLFLLGIWKKNLWLVEKHRSKRRIFLWYIINFIVAIYGVVFPAWVWVIFYFIYTGFFWMTSVQARATGATLWFIWTIPISISLLFTGQYNLLFVLLYFAWASIWSYFGAKRAGNSGNNLMRITVLIWISFLAIYFLGVK